MTIAAIIGAVISVTTSITSAAVNAKKTREANSEGLRLANIKRQDEMKIRESNEKLNKWEQRFKKKQLDFQKSEARKDRTERGEEKGYNRRRQFFADSLNIVNQNPAARENFMSVLRRRI